MLSTPLTFAKGNDNIAKRDHIAKRNDIVLVLELALEKTREKQDEKYKKTAFYNNLKEKYT